MSRKDSGLSTLRRIPRRRRLIIFCLLGVIIVAVIAQAAVHPDRKASLRIVFTGGIQGHLSYEQGVSLGYENIADIAATDTENTDSNTLLLDMGDSLGASRVAEQDDGKCIIDIMNEAGYDAMVPGSLDFVYGSDELRSLRSESEFPIIAANITDSSGKNIFEEYTVININNVRIGLTGVTDGLSAAAAESEGLNLTDPSDAVSSAISNMGSRVDTVIVMADITDSDEISQIAAIDNVGIVLTGAADESSSNTLDDGTLVASPAKHGKDAGVISLNAGRDSFSSDCSFISSDEASSRAGNSEVASSVDTALSGLSEAENTAVGRVNLREINIPEQESETQAETDYIGETAGETAATETESETQAETVDNNNYETATGDLAADAMLGTASSYGAKAALIRDRDIHGTLRTGSVKRGEVDALFDDDRYPVVCSLTGGELRTILEDSFSGYPAAADFLQVSGITYTYESNTGIGSALSDIRIDLQPVEDGAAYTVVLSDDIASDYNIISRNGAYIAALKSMGTTLCEYISSNDTNNNADTVQSYSETDEYETSESETGRINIR